MTIPTQSFGDKVEIYLPRLDLSVDMKTYKRETIVISSLTTYDSNEARQLAHDILEACDEYDKVNKEYGV